MAVMNEVAKPNPSVESPKIFVVEDEALVAMELEDRLRHLGYVVCGSAARGEDAERDIPETRPDLVLMDIKLAGKLTGIEVARHLRESSDVPVVFLSVYSDPALLEQAAGVDPFGYLVKPFEERELHATIRMALYKHRMERALREANAALEERAARLNVVAGEMDAARLAALNMMEDAVEARAGLEAANAALVDEVAERKRAENALRQLSAELEQRVLERTAQLDAANKELEAFSYSVSHDLRAPLRHIDGFSKILLEDYSAQLDDRGRHTLDRIQAGCARMGQLIHDLLSLSRVSRQALRRERVDLTALARRIAADLRTGDPERSVDLVLADHLVAWGDPSLLRIVLVNLLGNAWKYSAKRRHARIELGAMSIAEYGMRIADSPRFATPGSFNPQSEIRNPPLVYFIRDNGAGFDPAFSDKLFVPFQRLHSAKEFEGTGIGLAIVARIIRRHGGQVWAESAVEQGATFYFTLGGSSWVDPV